MVGLQGLPQKTQKAHQIIIGGLGRIFKAASARNSGDSHNSSVPDGGAASPCFNSGSS
jgi:hypothetical protein